jgi:hypothetical protein
MAAGSESRNWGEFRNSNFTPPILRSGQSSRVLGHAIVSWFTEARCVGVSMAVLDSGGTEAPLSLSLMCLVHVVTRYPLKPLTDLMPGSCSFHVSYRMLHLRRALFIRQSSDFTIPPNDMARQSQLSPQATRQPVGSISRLV